jgi:hypothetical protein
VAGKEFLEIALRKADADFTELDDASHSGCLRGFGAIGSCGIWYKSWCVSLGKCRFPGVRARCVCIFLFCCKHILRCMARGGFSSICKAIVNPYYDIY